MKYFLVIFSLLLPIFAHAAVSNARDLILAVTSLITLGTPIVAGIALAVFFWGLARFMYHSDSEDSKEEGKRIMFWGIIALFVMFSVWGLVTFVASGLGVDAHPANMLYEL